MTRQSKPSFDACGAGELEQEQKVRLDKARSALAAAEARHAMHSVSRRDLARETMGAHAYGVYHIRPSIQEMLEALAQIVKPEDWVAVVAVSDIGWEAAQKLGIDTGRVVLVPHPKDQIRKVVAATIEGFDVVALGEVSIRPSEQRALAGRARKLNTTVLTMVPWQMVSKPFVRQIFARQEMGGDGQSSTESFELFPSVGMG